jgi:hypothetical protein
MRLRSTLNKRFGFSLIETAIVLGAVGLVVGSIWLIMESTRGNSRAALLTQQTTLIANNVRHFYATRVLPTGAAGEITAADFTCTLQNWAVFPEDTCNGTCASCTVPASSPRPVNIFNGTILVNIVNVSPYTSFNLNHAGVDRKACSQLVTSLSTKAALLGLTSITANGNTPHTSFPVAPDAATDDCDDETDNQIDLVFQIKR